jgi:hypothetical protein
MEANALDFWLGTWACTWEGGQGTNTITREFDGRVVQERFEAIEPEAFSGLSVSVSPKTASIGDGSSPPTA